MPAGYGFEYSGISREEQAAGSQTIYIFLLCLAFVYLLLSAQYESYLLPFAVLLSLPVGLSGIFVFWLHLLPGASPMTSCFAWRELVMPVAVLVLAGTGYLARMTRASMVEVMSSAYVRTARMKGASFARVVLRHALRNAMVTPVTVVMLYIPWLLANVVVVEVFFAYRGFATLLDAAK